MTVEGCRCGILLKIHCLTLAAVQLGNIHAVVNEIIVGALLTSFQRLQ